MKISKFLKLSLPELPDSADIRVISDSLESIDSVFETLTEGSVTTRRDVDLLQTAIENKVDKQAGKGLSSNDYTTNEKLKLEGIEAEANKTIVDDQISNSSTNPVQNRVIYNELVKKANLTDLPLIMVSDTEPQKSNIIWLKPLTPDEMHSEPTILVQEREPDINNCVWFKPYSISPEVLEALLNMNPDTSTAEILSGIGGTDYGVDNATTSEDIPEGVYNFTIL